MDNTESIKKGFWQFPLSLRFVVVWIFFLCLFNFWIGLDGFLSESSIRIVSLIAGAIYFYLAIGLADKDNSARILTSITVGVGTLVRFVLMILAFSEGVGLGYIEFSSVKYPVSKTQLIFFLIINILFNLVIIYILLQPSTKALFSREPVSKNQSISQEAT